MPFPDIAHCLICDAAHHEGRGKLSLLGFFGVAPDVSVTVSSREQVSLTFVMIGGTGEGQYQAAFDIVAANEETIVVPRSPPSTVTLDPDSKVMFAITILATYPADGRYRFRLFVNGQVRGDAGFELKQGVVAA